LWDINLHTEQDEMATATIESQATERTRKLKWYVPRWHTVRELKKVAPIVFGVRPVFRIIAVTLAIGAAICLGTQLVFPQVQLGFVWKALLGIPAMFAYLGFYFLIRLLIPDQIRITDKYLCHSTGQSAWRVKISDIESSSLVVYSTEHLRLIIDAKGRKHKLALPPTTDLHRLTSRLGSTIVFDKRCQFQTAQALVKAATSG
jgi:hypothetical protein